MRIAIIKYFIYCTSADTAIYILIIISIDAPGGETKDTDRRIMMDQEEKQGLSQNVREAEVNGTATGIFLDTI